MGKGEVQCRGLRRGRHHDRAICKDSQNRLLAVNEQLKRGVYQPKSVKRVWIEKPGSAEKRPLGIPTVTDRVVQAAVRMVIEPIFEKQFAKHSYGFRPGCGCKDALRRVEELLRAGNTYVVDVDIKSYFDAIPHDQLLSKVRERIADGRVLGLIEEFLKQGVIEGTNWQEAKETGTPQGGVISPLLANIYLNLLDWMMIESGFEMVRYADDMVVLCRDQEEAANALNKLKGWMEEAELTLHPDKTRTVDMNLPDSHFDFLGYRFKRTRRDRLIRLIRPKSLKKLRESIKPRTKRNNGKSMEVIIADINRTLKSWFAYFKHVHSSELETIDRWIRVRLRSILRKRQGGKGRGRGRDHYRWPNRYFTGLGLFCLLDVKVMETASLREGANY
jgi:RNA-directed DNA polymerase